jgi:PAS domain S-box-containing protein
VVDDEVVVPVGRGPIGSERLGRFVLAQLDLSQSSTGVGLWGAVSVFFGSLFVATIVLQFYRYDVAAQDQERILERFSRILSGAPAAFACLDENEDLVEVNEAFVTMLGFSDNKDLLVGPNGQRRNFQTIVSAESLAAWRTVREARYADQRTRPYEILLTGKNGRRVRALVHGESIMLHRRRSPDVAYSVGIVWRCQLEHGDNAHTSAS